MRGFNSLVNLDSSYVARSPSYHEDQQTKRCEKLQESVPLTEFGISTFKRTFRCVPTDLSSMQMESLNHTTPIDLSVSNGNRAGDRRLCKLFNIVDPVDFYESSIKDFSSNTISTSYTHKKYAKTPLERTQFPNTAKSLSLSESDNRIFGGKTLMSIEPRKNSTITDSYMRSENVSGEVILSQLNIRSLLHIN